MIVTFSNEPIELSGKSVALGDYAPDFKAVDPTFKTVSLSDFDSDYIVLSSVPSLETRVCDYQTKTFNENLSKFKKVSVITLSNDLPFTQRKWCGASGLNHVITLSDYIDLEFANQYGVLLKPYRLLARAVFVLNKERKIIYKEIVENVSNHPSYEEVTNLLSDLTK
ncbi:MAG: thiol peroxidase [Candidatus Izemoplasmataceae bacterium]